MTSAISSSKLWPGKLKNFALVFLVLSLIGFADATFLTVEHYRGVLVPCSLIEGCEKVLTSDYAEIGGLPVAFIGSIYYLAIFLLTFLFLTRGQKRLLLAAGRLAVLGFIVSLGFVFLQLFVIKAVCLYCLASAVISTTLFVLFLILIKSKRQDTKELPTN